MWTTPRIDLASLWHTQVETTPSNLLNDLADNELAGVGATTPPSVLGLEIYEVSLVLLLLFAVMVLLHWGMWMLGWGRFKRDEKTSGSQHGWSIGRAVAELLVKIIDDFRHLLALVVLAIFFIAMLFMLGAGWNDVDKMKDGLEMVVASLGGLVGSIVGYYFGESAARKTGTVPPVSTTPPQQGGRPKTPLEHGGGNSTPPTDPNTPEADPAESPIKPAKPPPGLAGNAQDTEKK